MTPEDRAPSLQAPPGDYRRILALAEYAWTIIANAGGGDWTTQSEDWQKAAARWREDYHAELARQPLLPSEPEKIAALFHYQYERLAPRHGYATREESQVPWTEVPENNKALMIDVVTTLLDQGAIDLGPLL